MNLIHLPLRLDVGKGILVHLLVFAGYHLLLLDLVLPPVYQWILQVRHLDPISLEKPLFELLKQRSLERSDVCVDLDQAAPDCFYLFCLLLAYPFGLLLLLQKLKFLLVYDSLGQLLWSFTFLLQAQLLRNLLQLSLHLLTLFCSLLDLLSLLLELLLSRTIITLFFNMVSLIYFPEVFLNS